MSAVPNTSIFCSLLISCFPGMLLGYCQSDIEKVSFVPIFSRIALILHSKYAVILL